MAPRKRTFFEKITGTIPLDDEHRDRGYDDIEYDQYSRSQKRRIDNTWDISREKRHSSSLYQQDEDEIPNTEAHQDEWLEHVDTNEGELSLDMYQTADEIVIQAMVAGVRPDDVDITISRGMVIIKGHRDAPRGVEDYDYFHKELYWGAFSRTVMLPQEVEVEECEAIESHGLLILHLPKLNTAKESKLTVKSRV